MAIIPKVLKPVHFDPPDLTVIAAYIVNLLVDSHLIEEPATIAEANDLAQKAGADFVEFCKVLNQIQEKQNNPPEFTVNAIGSEGTAN